MFRNVATKRALLITTVSSLLLALVTFLISIPARVQQTDIWGHTTTHTPAGFVWFIYIFIAIAALAGGGFLIIEGSEHIK